MFSFTLDLSDAFRILCILLLSESPPPFSCLFTSSEQSEDGEIPDLSGFGVKVRQCELLAHKKTNFIPLLGAQALGFLSMPEKYTLMGDYRSFNNNGLLNESRNRKKRLTNVHLPSFLQVPPPTSVTLPGGAASPLSSESLIVRRIK